jgi:hypothetical protein
VRGELKANGLANFQAARPGFHGRLPGFSKGAHRGDFPFGRAGVATVGNCRQGRIRQDIFFDGGVVRPVFEILGLVTNDHQFQAPGARFSQSLSTGNVVVGRLALSAHVGEQNEIRADAALLHSDKHGD